MDEVTLNDLLECSVCLERLDTLSKVLPCQHTFCRKCLEEILKKHKELRCPECRILVNAKVDELPPNVLLMRILEGMRNSVPKKQQRNLRPMNQTVLTVNSIAHTPLQGTLEQRITPTKQPTIHIPHQPYAKALYDFISKEEGDLNFKRGDIIILKKRIDSHWYQGECGGKQGFFPLSYVQTITPVPSHLPQCKALYDFRMTNDEDEGCLAFNKSDIINVIRRVDENWAEGKLNGKIGIFPLAFVELNNLARSLMKLSTNSQPGPSRVAPPTPTTEDSTPLIPTDHSRSLVSSHRNNQPQQVQAPAQQPTLPTSDSSSTVSSGSSSTTTPNVSSSNTSSGSSTAPSSPASPPPRTQQAVPPRTQQAVPPRTVPNVSIASSVCSTPQRTINGANSDGHHNHSKEKRHSFTSLTPPHHNGNSNRHSAEILAGETCEAAAPAQPVSHERPNKKSSGSSSSDVHLPAAYIALYPYKPQKPDELELRKGGIYMVSERCQDGWFKGTSNRTQKCGVFPGNYVQLARGVPNTQSPNSREGHSESKSTVSFTRTGKSVSARQASNLPPELPPRSNSPALNATNTISSSWHGQQDSNNVPLGRSSSAIMTSTTAQSHLTTSSSAVVATTPNKSEKSKEKKDKGVSLMRRLTSIKRSKSPPPTTYSMDNPVFEDSSTITASATSGSTVHPVHVRSGSCPSQLLQIQPADHHRLFGSNSQRLKHKERPSILTHSPRGSDNHSSSVNSSPDVHHHRKSNSLDAGNHRPKTGVQTVRERFRCIAPYPPNSEYELELQVHDIIYVHKKRDDGWYKGTQQRTGKTGLFPASFVESF